MEFTNRVRDSLRANYAINGINSTTLGWNSAEEQAGESKVKKKTHKNTTHTIKWRTKQHTAFESIVRHVEFGWIDAQTCTLNSSSNSHKTSQTDRKRAQVTINKRTQPNQIHFKILFLAFSTYLFISFQFVFFSRCFCSLNWIFLSLGLFSYICMYIYSVYKSCVTVSFVCLWCLADVYVLVLANWELLRDFICVEVVRQVSKHTDTCTT